MSVLADIWANERANIDPELARRLEEELGLTKPAKKPRKRLINGEWAVVRKRLVGKLRAHGAFAVALGSLVSASFEINTIVGLVATGLAALWVDDKVNH